MNVEQLEKGNELLGAINFNGESLKHVRYFQKHPGIACNYAMGLKGAELKCLSDEEMKDILNLIEKYLTAANQRLIDEFDAI